MRPALTFTFDLEDHRPSSDFPKRYDLMTRQVFDLLNKRNVKATIFTVGELAKKEPSLIKELHKTGHEIAHHSLDHTQVTQQTPEAFKDHTRRGKDILEDITGAPVKGYRAPVFSVTKQSLWAVDILKELDFKYSSSTLPASNPLHGLPGIPKKPFRWANGLLEIPAPVCSLGPVALPYLGGFYFRYLPFFFIKNKIMKNDEQALWTYFHPYDFDWEEENWRIKGASVPVSLLLWFNRKGSMRKLEKLLDTCEILPPFKDQNFPDNMPVVDPATL